MAEGYNIHALNEQEKDEAMSRKQKEQPPHRFFKIGTGMAGEGDVYLNNEDIARNVMLLGATGHERQEIFLAMLEEQLAHGHGAIFASMYSDIQTVRKVRDVCRRYGKENDLLVLDFRNPDEARDHVPGIVSAMRFEPFAKMNHRQLTQMLVPLMGDGGGDSSIWRARAIAMLSRLMKALVWMRDNEDFELSPATLEKHLTFRAVEDLGRKESLPSEIREGVRSYLNSLPGYIPERGDKQSMSTLDHHGFLEMQFTHMLEKLSDEEVNIEEAWYGLTDLDDIPRQDVGSIDFWEVICNRRVLVVLFPQFASSVSAEAYEGMMFRAVCNALAENGELMRILSDDRPYLILADSTRNAHHDLARIARYGRSRHVWLVYGDDGLAYFYQGHSDRRAIVSNCCTKVVLNTPDPEVRTLHPKMSMAPLLDRHQACVLKDGKCVQLWLDHDLSGV